MAKCEMDIKNEIRKGVRSSQGKKEEKTPTNIHERLVC